MARTDAYPQTASAYEARETAQTITDMGSKRTPAAAVKERPERAEQARVVERLPPAPIFEEMVAKKVGLYGAVYMLIIIIIIIIIMIMIIINTAH